MKKIFIGLIFILAGFNIDIGTGSIDILPDFIGFYFILKGLTEDNADFWRFHYYAKHAKILIGISAAMFIGLPFYDLNLAVMIIILVLALVQEFYLFWLIYRLIDELQMIGFERKTELLVEKLEKLWNAVIAFQVFGYLMLWIPPFAIILEFISIVISIVFLVKFKKTVDAYYASETEE